MKDEVTDGQIESLIHVTCAVVPSKPAAPQGRASVPRAVRRARRPVAQGRAAGVCRSRGRALRSPGRHAGTQGGWRGMGGCG